VFAYIDAGSGSLLVQLLAGGVAGLAAFVKFRWGGFRRKFGRSLSVPVDDHLTDPPTQPQASPRLDS
jgi:hypothetical protein